MNSTWSNQRYEKKMVCKINQMGLTLLLLVLILVSVSVMVFSGMLDSGSDGDSGDDSESDGEQEVLVPGCTQRLAVNYDPLATKDDGSCIDPNPGCMNRNAENFDEEFNVSDPTSCIYAEEGCIDWNGKKPPGVIAWEEANGGVTWEDAEDSDKPTVHKERMCQHIEGCTLSDRPNYDPLATKSDASCLPEKGLELTEKHMCHGMGQLSMTLSGALQCDCGAENQEEEVSVLGNRQVYEEPQGEFWLSLADSQSPPAAGWANELLSGCKSQKEEMEGCEGRLRIEHTYDQNGEHVSVDCGRSYFKFSDKRQRGLKPLVRQQGEVLDPFLDGLTASQCKKECDKWEGDPSSTYVNYMRRRILFGDELVIVNQHVGMVGSNNHYPKGTVLSVNDAHTTNVDANYHVNTARPDSIHSNATLSRVKFKILKSDGSTGTPVKYGDKVKIQEMYTAIPEHRTFIQVSGSAGNDVWHDLASPHAQGRGVNIATFDRKNDEDTEFVIVPTDSGNTGELMYGQTFALFAPSLSQYVITWGFPRGHLWAHEGFGYGVMTAPHPFHDPYYPNPDGHFKMINFHDFYQGNTGGIYQPPSLPSDATQPKPCNSFQYTWSPGGGGPTTGRCVFFNESFHNFANDDQTGAPIHHVRQVDPNDPRDMRGELHIVSKSESTL